LNAARLRFASWTLSASENWARTPPAAREVEPAAEPRALEEDDIDAGLGEVEGGARAHDSTADDDHGGGPWK